MRFYIPALANTIIKIYREQLFLYKLMDLRIWKKKKKKNFGEKYLANLILILILEKE